MAHAASAAIAHQILRATDQQALKLLAPVQAQLREPPGAERAIGDVVRSSPQKFPAPESLRCCAGLIWAPDESVHTA
jgi:hypothetical protein